MADTIWVSLGEKEYRGGTITETSGQDISAVPITVAVARYYTPPNRTSAISPDVDQPGSTGASRVIKKLIDSAAAVADGQYLWAWVGDSPEVLPLRLDGPFDIK